MRIRANITNCYSRNIQIFNIYCDSVISVLCFLKGSCRETVALLKITQKIAKATLRKRSKNRPFFCVILTKKVAEMFGSLENISYLCNIEIKAGMTTRRSWST